MLLWDSTFIKTEEVFRNSAPRQYLVTQDFRALYFDLLTGKIERSTHDTNLPSSQFVKAVKTAGAQCIPLVNGIMNSENAPKEFVKSFIDLANMAKGLMDENQQPSVQESLERMFHSTRDEER